MQILSPSRRSWRQIGGTACERLTLGRTGLRACGRGQHAPARPCGGKATIEPWKQGWFSRGWPIVWRRAAIRLPRFSSRMRSCRPGRLRVLCSCGLEPVASVRGFEYRTTLSGSRSRQQDGACRFSFNRSGCRFCHTRSDIHVPEQLCSDVDRGWEHHFGRPRRVVVFV
jgi:hypothetical protein